MATTRMLQQYEPIAAISNEDCDNSMALVTMPLDQGQHMSRSSMEKGNVDNNLWCYERNKDFIHKK